MSRKSLVHVICAWCHKVLAAAPGQPVSHGCCDDCLAKVLEEV